MRSATAATCLATTARSSANEKGYCPLGNRYVFEIIEGGDAIQRYWATNCANRKTYKGNLSLTLMLFQAQVPDYNTLVAGLDNL